VLSIDKTDKAISAFHLLYEKSVSGVAVLDGKDLFGNISATDIKHIGSGAQLMSRLFLPAEEFLKLVPKKVKQLTPQCIIPSNTLEEVFTNIFVTRFHRMYVVNDSKRPIGVVSLGDILEVIIQHI